MDDYCDREDWLAAYLDRTVSERERVRIEKHLATCSKCLSELIAAKSELDDIAESVPGLRRAQGSGITRLLAARIATSWAGPTGSRRIGRLARLTLLSASISTALALVIGVSFLLYLDTHAYDPDYREAVHLLQDIMSVSRIGPLRLSDGRREPSAGGNPLRSGESLHRNIAFQTERELQRALNRYPGDHEILTALGHLYISIGQPERAETYYENALLIRPHDPRILNNIAVAAYRRGEPSRALEHLVQAGHMDNTPP
jgi:tetratricopeptide (TPR) repeat protein